MKVRIFDLDNCISNDERRIKNIDWHEPDIEKRYARYHAELLDDSFHNGHLFGADSVVIFTARPMVHAPATISWLERNGIDFTHLFMRESNDTRSSVELKRSQLSALLATHEVCTEDIMCAYDDREDVVQMYRELGLNAQVLKIHDTCAYTKPAATKTAADILADMADTYRERNKIYGDNYKRVGHIMTALHPIGIELKTAEDHELFHLWSLMIVKLSRFAVSGLTHEDSVHDLCVYGAMVEAILKGRRK